MLQAAGPKGTDLGNTRAPSRRGSNYHLKANNKSDSGRDPRRTHARTRSDERRADQRCTKNCELGPNSSEKHLKTRKDSGPAPGHQKGISSPEVGLCGAMKSTKIKIRIRTKSSPRGQARAGRSRAKIRNHRRRYQREQTPRDPESVENRWDRCQTMQRTK